MDWMPFILVMCMEKDMRHVPDCKEQMIECVNTLYEKPSVKALKGGKEGLALYLNMNTKYAERKELCGLKD